MSVILDALRRRRRESPAESSARGVPAGLGLATAVSTVSRQRDQRFKLIGLAVLVVLLGVWVDLRFNSRAATQPVPAQSVQPPVVVSRINEPPPVTPPPAAAPSPQPRTPKPESRIPAPGPRIPDPGSRVPSPGARVDHFALALRYQSLGDFERARAEYLAVYLPTMNCISRLVTTSRCCTTVAG